MEQLSISKNRNIRIFISSTFSDMQEERDHLVNHVFHILRRKAEERNVTITEVDLRWGITKEDSDSGRVVSICMEEIDNTRPFFIGLFCYYLYLSYAEDSAVQKPEKLYHEKLLMLYCGLLIGLFSFLMVVDIPQLNIFTSNELINFSCGGS